MARLDRLEATLDHAKENIATVQAGIASLQAAMPDLCKSITKSLMETPGFPEAIAAEAVRNAQKPGGPPVSLALVDSVLAAEGVDISDRFRIKEVMIKRGQAVRF
jgi:hypothetical protein